MSNPSDGGSSGAIAAPREDPLVHYAEIFDRLCSFLGDGFSGGGYTRDSDALAIMARHGLRTAEQIAAFLDAIAQASTELSIKIDGWLMPEDYMAASADPIQLLVAAVVFSSGERAAIVTAGHNPVMWLDVVMEIGRAARARGDATVLVLENFDHDQDSVVLRALQAGMTPAGLLVHAAAMAGRGVSNGDLASAVGEDAVPADLLAADKNAARHLAEIRTGQSYFADDAPSLLDADETVAVLCVLVAQGAPLDAACADARLLVAAGARDAAEVLALYLQVRDGVLARSMIERACVEGVAPQQWVPLVKRIGRRASTYATGFMLPLRTLAEAADAGVSVRQWDENVRAKGARDTRQSALEAIQAAPWNDIYPTDTFAGRVVELAKAGVSPGLVEECYRFFGGLGWSTMVDDIVMLHSCGLTLPVMTELARPAGDGSPIVMSVAQAAEACKLGMGVDSVREVRPFVGGHEFYTAMMGALRGNTVQRVRAHVGHVDGAAAKGEVPDDTAGL